VVTTILSKTSRVLGQALADVATIGTLSERSIRRGEVLSEQLIAATERALHPSPPELIALTCNENRHLFTKLITEPTRRLTDPLAWSRWRQRHQHQAAPATTAANKLNSQITIYGWSTSAPSQLVRLSEQASPPTVPPKYRI
jgi:hypothetical protein